jgi:hypothetical protein
MIRFLGRNMFRPTKFIASWQSCMLTEYWEFRMSGNGAESSRMVLKISVMVSAPVSTAHQGHTNEQWLQEIIRRTVTLSIIQATVTTESECLVCVWLQIQLLHQNFSYASMYLWRNAVAQLVEALRYKPEGRGFDSWWCHWNILLT